LTLHETLVCLFPFCNDLDVKGEKGFQPHLTVGQFQTESQAKSFIKIQKQTWSPMSFTVNEIFLIKCTKHNPFQVSFTIQVGQSGFGVPKEIEPKEELMEFAFPVVVQLDIKEKVPLVADQVIKWLHNPNHKQSLPKTVSKLCSSIKPFCEVPVIVLPVQWVLNRLKAEQFFTIEDNLVIPLNKPFEEPKSHFIEQIDFQQLQTYNKCCNWFFRQVVLPKTIQGLMKHLEQICTIMVKIPPYDIVEHLVSSGIVTCCGEEVIYQIK